MCLNAGVYICKRNLQSCYTSDLLFDMYLILDTKMASSQKVIFTASYGKTEILLSSLFDSIYSLLKAIRYNLNFGQDSFYFTIQNVKSERNNHHFLFFHPPHTSNEIHQEFYMILVRN